MKIALINENSQAAKNEIIYNSLKNTVEPMGHETSPLDAYLFGQVNDGNAIAMPFAQGFGWGAELNLDYTFEKLFSTEMGGGYPKERVVPEQRNKKILDEVKKITHHDIMYVLENIDQDFLKTTVSGEKFKELFFANCQVPEIADYIKKVISE